MVKTASSVFFFFIFFLQEFYFLYLRSAINKGR